MIFGNDNRTPVDKQNRYVYEYAPAVQIISRFADGTVAQGSGTIVGVNDVLTAAHVIYNAGHGGYAVGIEVTPLRFGEVKPFGVVYATDVVVSDGWIRTSSYESDYGLITLAQPLGYQTGWIDIGAVNEYEVLFKEVQSYGYPGDLDNGDVLYRVSGTIDQTYRTLLKFTDDLDAMGGQSGSGIIMHTVDGLRVQGILSYESYGPDYNAAVMLNGVIASEIEEWIEANDTGVAAKLDAPTSLRPIIEGLNYMAIAFVGRNGTKAELDFLNDAYASGSDAKEIAQIIYGSDAYASTAAASMNNDAFLSHVFANVLEITYSAEEFSYWLGALDGGMRRSDALLLCSTLPLFREKHMLDVYETWHRNYRDFAVEAVANDENTTLIAREEDSLLRGGGGDDVLTGSNGADYLYGMGGNDTLTGGGGGDFFAWDIGMGIDRILDFNVHEDMLRLRSDFDWRWGADVTGNLTLTPNQGSGAVVLVGLGVGDVSAVFILQG
ncbi:MAG: hypothetical protein B7Y17_00430 [Sulfuricurvum sp. 24-42-5]|nr:MAG: hypothetical protein B7Y17_00430 [Sulfuricurvum sp. 24-42-5]